MVLAQVNGPDGATLEYTNRYATAIERIGQSYPEFDRMFATIGNPTVAQGNIFLRTVPWEERKRTTQEMARDMTPRVAGLTGVSAFPITPPSLGQGFTQRPINYVIITSDSYQNLVADGAPVPGRTGEEPRLCAGRHRSAAQQARDQAGGGPRTCGRQRRRRGRDCACRRDHAGRARGDAFQARRRTIRRDRADHGYRSRHAVRHRAHFRARQERHDDSAVGAGQDPRDRGAARTQPLRATPLGVDHRQPVGRLFDWARHSTSWTRPRRRCSSPAMRPT